MEITLWRRYSYHDIDNVVAALKREYGEELSFNLCGSVGTGHWAARSCIEHNIPFHVYLSFTSEVISQHWSESQKQDLNNQINNARSCSIVDPVSNSWIAGRFQEKNEQMIDNANFVISFWVGKRQGQTFDAMNYALEQSKFVFNGLDALRPIFKENLGRGWSPPTVIGYNDE